MINPCEAIYTGENLEDAALGVVQFRSPGGTIKAVYLYVGDEVSDDAVFNVSIENVALWTAGDRLTIADSESSAEKTGLNIATTRGDIIQLDLEEVPETGIVSPVTVIFDIDDGVELPDGAGLTTEAVQDIVGAMMVSGTNTLWTYDDEAGTLKVDAANLSDEDIQDKVAAMLSAGTNVTVNYNDPAGTLTISSTDTTRTNEEIMDVVAALLTQGSNVTLTYNDGADTLTIAASGGGGSGYDGGRPSSALNYCYISEDFVGNEVGTFGTGKFSSGTNPTIVEGEANHPGIIGISSSSSSIVYLIMAANTGNGMVFPTDNFDATFVARIAPNAVYNVVNVLNFRIGFGHTVASNPPLRGAYFEKLATEDTIHAVTRNSGAQTRSATSMVIPGGTFSSWLAWYKWRIRRVDASTIGFSLNGGTEILMTTNLPTLAITPFVQIWMTGTGSVALHLDFFDLLVSGLTRY